jgi:uncharacterized RDD family membrane protein YckC
VSLIIDNIIIGIIIGAIGSIIGFGMMTQKMVSWWIGLLYFVIYIGYFTFLEGSKGQTIGKMVTKIKVVREDGKPIDMNQALTRNILRIIDGLFAYLIGAILIWRSDKKQRLGDNIAKTIVVKAWNIKEKRQSRTISLVSECPALSGNLALGDVLDEVRAESGPLLNLQEALKIRTLDQSPMDYAGTQNNLGVAYAILAEAENRPDNCRKAKQAYGRAIEVLTRLNLLENIKSVEDKLSELDLICNKKFNLKNAIS